MDVRSRRLRKRRQVVTFSGLTGRPALSLNRGFAAPVTMSFGQPLEERMFLARRDPDLCARWQALTTILVSALIAGAAAARGGKTPAFSAAIAALMGGIATDAALEPAFRALALTLPSEADIAREIGSNIDPDAVFAAREGLAATIATANVGAFGALHDALADAAPYSPDAAAAGRRALRNVLLDYVTVASGSPAAAAAQYELAGNMTDRAAALSCLVQRHTAARETVSALGDFERRFAGDPLVLDKWFQIQAMASGAEAVETVRRLMRHRSFQATNPNRVRSLVGTFSMANQTGFHRADGAGYALLADVVLAVEPKNPQLAARLATAFRSWRSLEPGRREHARTTLLRIKSTPGLSADLSDIVERTLA